MTQEKKEGQDLFRAAHRCIFPPSWSSSRCICHLQTMPRWFLLCPVELVKSPRKAGLAWRLLPFCLSLWASPDARGEGRKCHHSSTQEEQVDCFLGPASPNICLRPWPSNSTIRTGGDAYGFTREDFVDVRTQLNVMTVNICRGAGPSEGYRAMLQGRAKEE